MTYRYKQFYRRKLPHIHSPGATLFVTFRLKGSVPKAVIEKWKAERKDIEEIISRDRKSLGNGTEDHQEKLRQFNRRWFAKYEEILHRAASGPVWLKESSIAQVVSDSFHHLDGKSYRLHAYSVMSNHAHVLFTPLLGERSLLETKKSGRSVFVSDDPPVGAIMQSIKGYSARKANALLNRKGKFWEPESYDHEVRDGDEFWRIVGYILNNPVKAGMVRDWKDWPFSWVSNAAYDRLSSLSLPRDKQF